MAVLTILRRIVKKIRKKRGGLAALFIFSRDVFRTAPQLTKRLEEANNHLANYDPEGFFFNIFAHIYCIINIP